MDSVKLSDESALLVVDIQDRLVSAMPEEAVPGFLKQVRILVSLAGQFDARVLYTEQYPEGLGGTEQTIQKTLDEETDAAYIEKVAFDACSAAGAAETFGSLPRHVVVCGLEAHICVWMTVRRLLEEGHEVIVPFDAVLSRRPGLRDNGLELMSRAGATVANVETLVFSSLESADHAAFKEFSRLVR